MGPVFLVDTYIDKVIPKTENLHLLARKSVLRELPAGRFLFQEGDADNRSYFLVSGVLELVRERRTVLVIRAGSPEARNPIAPASPRRYSARVRSERIEYLSIDSDALDMLLTWDQTGSYQVSELKGAAGDAASGNDWMTLLLQTKAFHRVPPANLQAIFMRMQPVDYQSSDVVIKQGEEGDYFYVIVQGACVVIRETPLNREGIRLAELGMGDTFGEEALITDARRNATVRMLSAGTLMRLAKADFRTLLNDPMIDWVDPSQATAIVAHGGCWLDVRLPSEFDGEHIEGALNVPLYFIRLKLKSLDRDTHYVVCCDTGRRSSAGAYILAERGFQASVLRGGLAGTDLLKK